MYISVARFVVHRRRALQLREVVRTFWAGPYEMRVFKDGGIAVGAVNRKVFLEEVRRGKYPKPPVFRDGKREPGRESRE